MRSREPNRINNNKQNHGRNQELIIQKLCKTAVLTNNMSKEQKDLQETNFMRIDL